MDRDIKFLETMSVDDFKSQYKVDKIEVKHNDRTGKFFIVFGGETGACSQKIGTGRLTDPVISEVCATDTGEKFFMLHQRGEGTKTVAVL
ncbi:MAG: hypothetical protein LKI53_09550 [Bacteroidales bacterium]|jgi:hypothetical protein|nr:hypothetical protein [Bacteroidales bacterium]